MQYLFGKKKFIDCCTVYPLRQIWQQRPSCLRPIHCSIQGTLAVLLFSSCTPDRSRNLLFPDILPLLSLLGESLVETVVNVLTSLPFIALGIQAPRQGFFYFFFLKWHEWFLRYIFPLVYLTLLFIGNAGRTLVVHCMLIP